MTRCLFCGVTWSVLWSVSGEVQLAALVEVSEFVPVYPVPLEPVCVQIPRQGRGKSRSERRHLLLSGSIVLYCIVLYCIVLYCIVLYCIVLYCIVLYCIVLYCIVLYCIVLYCYHTYSAIYYCAVMSSVCLNMSVVCQTRHPALSSWKDLNGKVDI